MANKKIGIHALIEQAERLAAPQPVELGFGPEIRVDANTQQMRIYMQRVINYELATKIVMCCLTIPEGSELWLRGLKYSMRIVKIPDAPGPASPVAVPADFYSHISVMLLERDGKINVVSREELDGRDEYKDHIGVYRWNDECQIVCFPYNEKPSTFKPQTALRVNPIENESLECILFEKLLRTPKIPLSELGLKPEVLQKLKKYGYSDTGNFDAVVDATVLPKILEELEHTHLREALWNHVLDHM